MPLPPPTTPHVGGGKGSGGKGKRGKSGNNATAPSTAAASKQAKAAKAGPDVPQEEAVVPPVPAAPVVIAKPADEGKPLAPEGWGPLTTRGTGEWHKEASIVLNRLRRKDTLVNDDFLSKYPELDINLTKVFSLGDEEMPEYLATVGQPMDLDFVEKKLDKKLKSGEFFSCPQQFVNVVGLGIVDTLTLILILRWCAIGPTLNCCYA